MRTASNRRTAPDVIHFAMPPLRDRETREELRAILRAHLALESTKTLRQFLVHLLAALGGLGVACVLIPDVTSQEVRHTLLWVWALCCLAAVTSAAVEWRFHTQEARLLARNQNSDSLIAEDRR